MPPSGIAEFGRALVVSWQVPASQLAAVVGELGGGQYFTRATIRGLAQPLGTAWELPSNRLTYTKPSEPALPLPVATRERPTVGAKFQVPEVPSKFQAPSQVSIHSTSFPLRSGAPGPCQSQESARD